MSAENKITRPSQGIPSGSTPPPKRAYNLTRNYEAEGRQLHVR